jgi:two-component system cell cycle sensor histidine kinase/response regulator CckA
MDHLGLQGSERISHPASGGNGDGARASQRVAPTLVAIKTPSVLAAFSLAVVATLASGLFRWALHPLLTERQPFVTFYLAVAFTAWYAGFWPAMVSAVIGGVLAVELVLPGPVQVIHDGGMLTGLIMYAVVSTSFAVLCSQLRTARVLADRHAALADVHRVELEQILRDNERMEESTRLQNEELQTAIEELEVTQEELRTQNDELAATRDEAELQRRKYQDLFNSAPDGYVVTDVKTVIQEANEAAATMLGESTSVLQGASLIAFLAVGHDAFHALVDDIQMRRPVVGHASVRVRTSRGASFDGELTAAGIRDATGNLCGLRWLLRDVTTRRETEAAVAHLAAIVDSSQDAILSKTLDGVITSFNPAAARLYGYRPDEIIGKSVEVLLPPDRKGEFRAVMEQIQQGRSVPHYDTIRRRKDGSLVNVSITISPTRGLDGRLIGASAIARDITDRITSEEELCKYRDHLEELVRERTEALRRSLEELRRTERLASIGTLAAGIAHEINNPINAILMTAQYGVDYGDDLDPKTAYRSIIEQAGRCGRIVKGILQFARHERLQKTLCNVNDVVRQAALLAKTYMASPGLALDFELDTGLPELPLSRTEFEQVIVNLVKNSIEAAHGRVNVRISTRRDAQAVVVHVADDGPGMPSDTASQVFDPFFSTRQHHGGTGLGLSICHRIVADHGGTIAVQSRPGEGTTFLIRLPVPG